MNPTSSQVRLGVLGIAALSLFGALFARLWFLQVVSADDLRVAANRMRTRTVLIPAPRGRILDRNGTVIVDSRPSLVVTVDWQRYRKLSLSDQAHMLDRLSAALTRSAPDQAVTVDELRRRIDDLRYSRFRPVPVAHDVSEQLAIYLAERPDEFPTVAASARHGAGLSVRRAAVARAGLRGHRERCRVEEAAGEAGPRQAVQPERRDRQDGSGGDAREPASGGPGQIRYEVDARNQPIRQIGHTDPVPGNDVYLTIDLKLQYYTEASLAGRSAAGPSHEHQDRRSARTRRVLA